MSSSSSSRAQKERIGRLNLLDKKLTRLFHVKSMTQNDAFVINYAYEEKQNLNFWYGLGLNGALVITANYLLFKNNRKLFQFGFCLTSFACINIFIRKRLETRYNNILEPYFEKYKVK